MSVHTKLERKCAPATRRTADSRPGRLQQRKPQPLAPRPCACPVRTSAPSRHRVTSAPAYHSSYLRNYHSFNKFVEVMPNFKKLWRRKKKKKLSACRGEGSVVGLQLRVRFVPAALLAMLRTTALALQTPVCF